MAHSKRAVAARKVPDQRPSISNSVDLRRRRSPSRPTSGQKRRKAPKGTERPTSPSTSCQSLASQASGPPRTIGDSQSAGQATTTRNNKTTTKGTNNQCRRWETVETTKHGQGVGKMRIHTVVRACTHLHTHARVHTYVDARTRLTETTD